jgi:hypothetical protein
MLGCCKYEVIKLKSKLKLKENLEEKKTELDEKKTLYNEKQDFIFTGLKTL